jgi:hypothetical protein
LNCDVVAVALSKKSTGEPEVFRVFEMGMALSQTKFYPFCKILDIVLWGSIYHMGQSL